MDTNIKEAIKLLELEIEIAQSELEEVYFSSYFEKEEGRLNDPVAVENFFDVEFPILIENYVDDLEYAIDLLEERGVNAYGELKKLFDLRGSKNYAILLRKLERWKKKKTGSEDLDYWIFAYAERRYESILELFDLIV